MNINNRLIAVAFTVIMGTTMCMAQRIAVVSENGGTSVFETLQEAINAADNGSIIYLPGGGFPLSDDVVITKKLCIIGLGYSVKSENVDGSTVISGNLWFNENSSGSSVMGCYITGNVNIGNDGASVNDVVVKYCNLNSIQVKNNNSLGTMVNQNYLRNGSNLARGTAFTNNVTPGISSENGTILNNLFVNSSNFTTCYVAHNIFVNGQGIGNNNTFYANMAKSDVGDYPVNVSEIEWTDLFVNYNNAAIAPASDFHFTEDYKLKYGSCGIYAGTGFNDSGQPPMPYISAKSIPGQTDASGILNVRLRVNTGEK